MINTVTFIGTLGREGLPGEERIFNQPKYRWMVRLAGVAVFFLLVTFTGML
jgi:hypothetical protein